MSIRFDTGQFGGRHVFVSGGTSGINLGIAEAFAACGARVAVLGRSVEKAHRAQVGLQALGTEALGLTGDVREPSAVQAAFEQAVARFGAIDVLVSGAAGNFPAAVTDMSPRAFQAVIDINLLGSFHVLRLAHEHLRRPGACVIQISASQAFTPTPFQAHVCAAKAGVDILTRTLALEWAAEGIRINSIAPGPIAGTEGMARLAPSPQALEAMATRVPLGRLGRREDIARLALMLASDWGSFVTGAVIPVDGGVALTGPRDFSAAAAAAREVRRQGQLR